MPQEQTINCHHNFTQREVHDGRASARSPNPFAVFAGLVGVLVDWHGGWYSQVRHVHSALKCCHAKDT